MKVYDDQLLDMEGGASGKVLKEEIDGFAEEIHIKAKECHNLQH